MVDNDLSYKSLYIVEKEKSEQLERQLLEMKVCNVIQLEWLWIKSRTTIRWKLKAIGWNPTVGVEYLNSLPWKPNQVEEWVDCQT